MQEKNKLISSILSSTHPINIDAGPMFRQVLFLAPGEKLVRSSWRLESYIELETSQMEIHIPVLSAMKPTDRML